MIAALVAGSVLTAGNLLAQDAPKDKPPGEQGGPGGPGMRAGRPDFAAELKLTEEQKPKFKEIMQSAMAKRKALREDATTSAEDKKAKAKAIQEETTKDMKALLTEEQFAKWEKMGPGNRRAPGGAGAPPKTDAKPDAQK